MRKVAFFLAIIGLYSCESTVYKNYHSFNNSNWNSDSVIEFNYEIKDTIISYDVLLAVRHSVDYEYQNLFLFIEGENRDTIEIMLADKIGKWHGRGLGDVREVRYNIYTNKVFKKEESYTIMVEQAMRYGPASKIDNLENILDIGLIIKEHNE